MAVPGRGPSVRSCSVPVLSTSRSAGATTSSRSNWKSSLAAISPKSSTAGSRAQPRSRSHASSGNAVASHTLRSSCERPVRSPASSPSTSVKPSSAFTVVPDSTHAGSGTSISEPGAPSGAPAASTRAAAGWPSTLTAFTVRLVPLAANSGLLAQVRKTSSHTCASGVKLTVSRPATVLRSSAMSKSSVTTGRSGHGSAVTTRVVVGDGVGLDVGSGSGGDEHDVATINAASGASSAVRTSALTIPSSHGAAPAPPRLCRESTDRPDRGHGRMRASISGLAAPADGARRCGHQAGRRCGRAR